MLPRGEGYAPIVLVDNEQVFILPTLGHLDRLVVRNGHYGFVHPLANNIVPDIGQTLAEVHPSLVLLSGAARDFFRLCELAIENGSSVLITPPLTAPPTILVELALRAQNEAVDIGVAINSSFLGRAPQLIKDGRIGEPLLFNSGVFIQPPTWSGLDATASARDTTLLWAVLQITCLLESDVAAFAAQADRTKGGISCILRLKSGIEGILQTAADLPTGTGTRFEIYGSKGMMMLTAAANATARPFTLVSAHIDIDALLANPTDPDRLKRRFAPDDLGSEPVTPRRIIEDYLSPTPSAPSLLKALRAQHAVQAMLADPAQKGWTEVEDDLFQGGA